MKCLIGEINIQCITTNLVMNLQIFAIFCIILYYSFSSQYIQICVTPAGIEHSVVVVMLLSCIVKVLFHAFLMVALAGSLYSCTLTRTSEAGWVHRSTDEVKKLCPWWEYNFILHILIGFFYQNNQLCMLVLL